VCPLWLCWVREGRVRWEPGAEARVRFFGFWPGPECRVRLGFLGPQHGLWPGPEGRVRLDFLGGPGAGFGQGWRLGLS
jgi:hypothetical protein